jgi:ribosomal protein S6--L-glutamate ligase
MQRGKFPYAHIDLMVLENGETRLTEINLRGGIKGARISPVEYLRQVTKIQRHFLDTL